MDEVAAVPPAEQAEQTSPQADGMSGAEEAAASTQPVKPGLIAAPRPSRRTPVESYQAERDPSEAVASAAQSEAPPATARPRESRAKPSSKQNAARSDASVADSGDAVQTRADPGGTTGEAAASDSAVAAPHEPQPITYWELPQSVRDGMPEMHITVLVYAEQPESRFLLIGGQRLVEGEEYQGGVTLKEIRRGGAVFVYRNYQFLVKG